MGSSRGLGLSVVRILSSGALVNSPFVTCTSTRTGSLAVSVTISAFLRINRDNGHEQDFVALSGFVLSLLHWNWTFSTMAVGDDKDLGLLEGLHRERQFYPDHDR
jgi:hypothetical protein